MPNGDLKLLQKFMTRYKDHVLKAQTQPERDAIAITGLQISSSIEEMPNKQLSF